MWDLETIRWLNNQAHYSSLRMGNAGLDSETTTPVSEPVFPLAVLAYKLIIGPPALVPLIDLLENSDSIVYFLELVREYLPDHEDEIMAQADTEDRIRRFCHYFDDRYFPLSDSALMYDDIRDFIGYMPVDLMGFTGEDYEEFNSFRDGFVLLLSMVESPYDVNERVPILERVKELVGKRLVELIPLEGWSLENIHRMLDGTEYEGCASFADWVYGCTGCMQLDANYTEYGPEMWDIGLVNRLTEEWPTVIELQDKMTDMYDWLEEDMYHNFQKLLAVILDREEEFPQIPKEQIPLPLDADGQISRKEVIENGR